ncbi:MAG: HEAT repeat domain-containing protein [Nitrospiraceae bacterium]|nr:HEAT repeat domain-containing protein [Nitrospiraceae bacterium]
MNLTSQKIRDLVWDLGAANSSKRREAAEQLSMGDERAVLPLIKALKDGNQGVQDAAMRSLIAIGGEAAAYMVLPLLRDDVVTRNMAVIILQELGKVVVPMLGPLMRDKDDDIRKFALDLICEIGECPAPELLQELLQRDPNPNVRVSAAKAIGALRMSGAVPALVEALRDTEWVSFAVLEALAAIKDDGSVEAVAELLMSPSEVIRSGAISCLASIETASAIAALNEHLEWEGTSDLERMLTVKSLLSAGVIPEVKGIRELLLELFTGGDWDDKMLALMGLSAFREERALFHIIDAAGSLDPSVPDCEGKLEEIRSALARFDCSPALIGLLRDARLKFRGLAFLLGLLGEMGCAEAAPLVEQMQDSNIHDIRNASVKTLRQIREAAGAKGGKSGPEGGQSIRPDGEKID